MNTIVSLFKQKVENMKEKNQRIEVQEKEDMKVATAVMGEISSTISQIYVGKKEDLQTLLQLKRKYEVQGSEIKKFFDYSLIDKLDDLIVQAQIDQEKSNWKLNFCLNEKIKMCGYIDCSHIFIFHFFKT
mgnify:CR=1 FL=1